MNEIMRIKPFWYHGCWVFTEPAVELDHEPFVGNINWMIDEALKQAGLHPADIKHRGANGGFYLTFSASPFDGSQLNLDFVRKQEFGADYQWTEKMIEGWLCDALFRFFSEAPRKIFIKVEPA